MCRKRGMEKSIYGGYVVITVGQIANICTAKREKRVSFAALRVYLACFEILAKRCVSRGKKPSFQVTEIAKLIGGATDDTISRALRELQREKLLNWSETSITINPMLISEEAKEVAEALGTSQKRPVPIPRRLLRTLVRHTKPSEVIAALAHCARCLFIKARQITCKGFVKATFIARVFGIAERAVHSARRWLIDLEFLVPQQVHQLVMNRWGARFGINLKQGGKKLRKKAVDNSKSESKSQGESAGLKNINPLKRINNSNNQKPTSGRRSGILSKTPRNISISAITLDDLHRMSSLEKLYQQAISAKWLPASERNARSFVAAAVRATKVPGDSVRIFVGIVKKQLWNHITHEQEDRAKQVMTRFCEKHPEAFRERNKGVKLQRAGKSREVSQMLKEAQSGIAEIGDSWKYHVGSEHALLPAKLEQARNRKVSKAGVLTHVA